MNTTFKKRRNKGNTTSVYFTIHVVVVIVRGARYYISSSFFHCYIWCVCVRVLLPATQELVFQRPVKEFLPLFPRTVFFSVGFYNRQDDVKSRRIFFSFFLIFFFFFFKSKFNFVFFPHMENFSGNCPNVLEYYSIGANCNCNFSVRW